MALMIILASCKKEKEYCWDFKITTIVSTSPVQPGYPQTTVNSFTECGITEEEANIISNSYNSLSSIQATHVVITTNTKSQLTKH